MLQIENLTKIYKRGKHEVKALDNVSFSLADNGFVFITGKSGSGKSTMLNLIGGLDNCTSGDIICDGNRLSEFSTKDFDNYRNAYLGFVFQDFHLIDDLNVKQNIEMAINLLGVKISKDEEDLLINEALASVDLGPEYKHRFVRELSGGQKQRVAIARALVKSPKLILADEPTGNLDSKTSRTILECLKKLSKDRLVVIVSHNLDDAKKYADRIIELADGKIISDVQRKEGYSNKASLIDGILTLPYCEPLSEDQLRIINNNLSQNNIKNIKQNSSGFTQTKETTKCKDKVEIVAKKLTFGKALSLAGFFTRKHWFASVTTILITSLLVLVLGICQFFIKFETAQAVGIAMAESDEEIVIARKGYLNEEGELENNYTINISDDEISEFKNSGYSSDIFILYDNVLPVSDYNCDYGNQVSPYRNFQGIYIKEGYGTLQCDMTFLLNNFGIDGELQFLAGSIDRFPYGVVITDLLADSLIALIDNYKNFTYEQLVGHTILNCRVTCNGIIKTNYKEKYVELIEFYKDISLGIDRSEDIEVMKELAKKYTSDVMKLYGLAYTVNPHFDEDIKNIDAVSLVNIESGKIIASNGGSRSFERAFLFDEGFNYLKDNEVAMDYNLYNQLFGEMYGTYTEENYNTDFTPITFTLEEYATHDNSILIQSMEVTIAHLNPQTEDRKNLFSFDASEDVFKAFHEIETAPYALYLVDNSQIDILYDLFTDNDFYVMSQTYQNISTIGNIVEIFKDFFGLILVGLLAICTLLIISNSYRNIKKRYYEIGVLKALGAKTSDVGFIFSMQTIMTGIIVCILSTISLILLCTPINNTLISALIKFLNNTNLGKVEIITFYPLTMIINTAFILLATTISCLVPLLKLHNIKPNIIMQKDEK